MASLNTCAYYLECFLRSCSSLYEAIKCFKWDRVGTFDWLVCSLCFSLCTTSLLIPSSTMRTLKCESSTFIHKEKRNSSRLYKWFEILIVCGKDFSHGSSPHLQQRMTHMNLSSCKLESTDPAQWQPLVLASQMPAQISCCIGVHVTTGWGMVCFYVETTNRTKVSKYLNSIDFSF